MNSDQINQIKHIIYKYQNAKYKFGEFRKPNMYPFNILNLHLKSIFNTSSTLQYKDRLNKSEIGKDILKCLKNVTQKYPKYIYSMRICSSPWYFEAHFDCDTNYALILYGAKRFLLFNIRDGFDKKYLNKIHGKNILTSKKILEQLGIKSVIRDIYPGEVIYIPPNTYHKVESIGKSKFSVLLNINGNNYKYQNRCSKKFDYLWKKQGKLCDIKECFY